MLQPPNVGTPQPCPQHSSVAQLCSLDSSSRSDNKHGDSDRLHSALESRGASVLLEGVSVGNRGVERILNFLGLKGKAFIGAFWIGCSSALIALIVRLLASNGQLAYFDETHPKFVQINTAAWTGITGMLGFLIVFRCQQAYGRYWSAMTNVHLMRAEWFDACSAICSFCSGKPDPVSQDQVRHFKQLLVRLFSILHAGALLRIIEPGVADEAVANIPVIDPMCFDKCSVDAFFQNTHKVELASQWIQHAILKGVAENVITAPPPIVSRAFQELANGLVKYHDALKVKTILFPAAYAQVCEALLMIHWFMTPFLVSLWVNSPTLATLFTFFGVFSMWSLSRVAACIENPFSLNSFITDSINMQKELNETLLLMLNPDVVKVPTMPGFDTNTLFNHAFAPVSLQAFCEATHWLDPMDTHHFSREMAAIRQSRASSDDGESAVQRGMSVMDITRQRIDNTPMRDLSARLASREAEIIAAQAAQAALQDGLAQAAEEGLAPPPAGSPGDPYQAALKETASPSPAGLIPVTNSVVPVVGPMEPSMPARPGGTGAVAELGPNRTQPSSTAAVSPASEPRPGHLTAGWSASSPHTHNDVQRGAARETSSASARPPTGAAPQGQGAGRQRDQACQHRL